jgi:hypothetical protein
MIDLNIKTHNELISFNNESQKLIKNYSQKQIAIGTLFMSILGLGIYHYSGTSLLNSINIFQDNLEPFENITTI